MAEKTLIVCDVCGEPAVQIVNMKFGGRTLTKDVCARHLSVMTEGARAPRPGRRAGALPSARPSATSAKRRGRPPGSKTRATRKRVTKRSTSKRAAGSRGGPTAARRDRKRTPKASSAS